MVDLAKEEGGILPLVHLNFWTERKAFHATWQYIKKVLWSSPREPQKHFWEFYVKERERKSFFFSLYDIWQ